MSFTSHSFSPSQILAGWHAATYFTMAKHIFRESNHLNQHTMVSRSGSFSERVDHVKYESAFWSWSFTHLVEVFLSRSKIYCHDLFLEKFGLVHAGRPSTTFPSKQFWPWPPIHHSAGERVRATATVLQPRRQEANNDRQVRNDPQLPGGWE